MDMEQYEPYCAEEVKTGFESKNAAQELELCLLSGHKSYLLGAMMMTNSNTNTTRRDFLKTSALIGGALMGPAILPGKIYGAGNDAPQSGRAHV